jgi:hypothetical protein
MVRSPAKTFKPYMADLPVEKRRVVSRLKGLILEHVPDGY